MTENMEKRSHERMELHGHIADIADGNFIYGGIIEDVSLGGLKLNSLPTKFVIEGRIYCIVVSGEASEAHFKIKVRPRWKRLDSAGLSMDVGFMVVDAPKEWTNLLNKMMPKKEKEERDVWDLRS
ncbi:MAG: PilZ domain-containing protein [Thermodesulfobacteriota bacterium]|nr:PilZ domain-containing protein [Thermodesulfobacteriota bacterium]